MVEDRQWPVAFGRRPALIYPLARGNIPRPEVGAMHGLEVEDEECAIGN